MCIKFRQYYLSKLPVASKHFKVKTIKFDMSFISIGYLVSTVTLKYIEIINSKEFLAKH